MAQVVGNLWDVTDKDADAFSYWMLRLSVAELGAAADGDVAADKEAREIHGAGAGELAAHSGSPLPVSSAVQLARKACRMAWLVGAATVVYGLPVELRAAGE